MNVRTVISLAVFLALGAGCRKTQAEADDKQSQATAQALAALTNQINEQSRQIASLKQQAATNQTAPAVIPKSPTERFKARVSTFCNDYAALPDKLPGEWTVQTYDVKQTDSLISPLIAYLTLVQEMNKNPLTINYRYDLTFRVRDNSWSLTSMKSTPFTRNHVLETEVADLSSQNEPMFPFARYLHGYFR